MAQWVRLQLGRGMFGGKRLISGDMVDEMHQAHTIIRIDSAARANNPDTTCRPYGMGWFLQDYRGRIVVHHGGNVDGFTAMVAMLPEEKFGVVLLTNMNGTGLPNALMLKLFDLQLKAPAEGLERRRYKRLEQRGPGRGRRRRGPMRRVANTTPSLPLAVVHGDVHRLALWRRGDHGRRTGSCS